MLRDSLHQPQYVEKLEKIIRFMIKEKALTLCDLDRIWEAQAGKHEAIVKNVHDLLAKLAWDFSPEQLDHLFECFQVRPLRLIYTENISFPYKISLKAIKHLRLQERGSFFEPYIGEINERMIVIWRVLVRSDYERWLKRNRSS